MKDAAQFFKTLADEARLQILWPLFNHRELCVCDIMDTLSINQSKTSRHLAPLRHARLVNCLPMIVVDGEAMCKGRYPNREMLAAFARVDAQPVAGRAVMSSCCGPAAPGRRTRGSGCC